MPAEFDWLDESRRIFALRLFDPFTLADIESFKEQMSPTIETGLPVYMLIDIRNISAMETLAHFTNSEGSALPELSAEQREQSRFAILGGGALVRLVFNLVEQGAEAQQFIRLFDYEDRAYSWLSECAAQV